MFGLSRSQKIAVILVSLLYAYVGYRFYKNATAIPASCQEKKYVAMALRQDLADCKLEVADYQSDQKESSNEHKDPSDEEDVPKLEPFVLARADMLAELNKQREGCSVEENFKTYKSYRKYGRCPDDWPIAQKMMLNDKCLTLGLPKRNCFASKPAHFKETGLSLQLEDRVWGKLWDDKVRWTNYECKSYKCLEERKAGDCRDCFTMESESDRWVGERKGKLNISSVMALIKGGARIGLDIGGGTGSFAARMVDFGATIITTGINIGAPFLETMYQRGLFGLHLAHVARLPFFDGTMDIVHSMHSVHALSPEKFWLMLLDWDRILRPGGLIWLEFYYQPLAVMPVYEDALNMLKYKKHEWYKEMYYDKGGRALVRLSLVLEKPNRDMFRLSSIFKGKSSSNL